MPARSRGRAVGFALAAALLGACLSPALAQQPAASSGSGPAKDAKSKPSTGAAMLAARVKANPNSKMLVRANEILYDYQREQVSAVGQVQIYYDGAVLEADKVTHDRKTNRLSAQGNVRYQAKDGNVIRTDAIDLDADFRDGFIQSLQVETPDRTRFAAARGQRSGGNITVLESGVYTACEPCKEDPKRPPLWQVKAARIVHNEKERVVHYENATLEFFGMPVAYFPYFWHPDPTVKRQTGFLQPAFFSNSRTGTGVVIPYYWAPAPNYDLTFAVAPMTRQLGPLVTAEWRHRLMKGAYEIRVAGIFQQDKDAFLDNGQPTPGYRDFRGSVETKGRFRINDKWHWGWDATLLTDRFFLTDYSYAGEGGGSERVSQAYLVGQGERSYFDLRAMGFIGFSRLDHREQLPYVHPVMDYSYVFDKPIMGGELGVRMNFISLTRQEADFAPTTQTMLGNANAAVPVAPHCDITKMGFNPGAATANCFLRGFSGDYTRFTSEMNWRRTLTNGWGMVFKPFLTARADFATRGVDNTFGITSATASYADPGRENLVRAMPTAGMEVRWPFISVHSWGTQVLEPIGQIIVRPNETHIGKFPNEDAHSLVFDDTNLFAIDKYSGYDRVEGGTRANVGVQYTANIHRYGMVNVLFGQSYHLGGKNSFAETGQIDGTGMQTGYGGLQSGLETDVSDYVSRIYYQPVGNISLAARFRFDRNTFDVRRMEIETRSTWDRLSLATIYARYEEQPLIGYLNRREGIYQTAAFKLHENWSIFGGVRYDLDRDKIDLGMIGLSYVDECFAASFSYVADETNLTYTKPVHRIMLRMNLRTLGGTGFSTQLGSDRTGP